MSRRIVVDGDREKSPKRQEAARKAWETMRANMPQKLANQVAQMERLTEAAQKSFTRAFNRWQRYSDRLKRLRKRQEDYLSQVGSTEP